MSGKRYTDEFKIEAAKQVTDRGHAVADVAERLGVSQHSMYQWMKQFGVPDYIEVWDGERYSCVC